jgi:Protein of unknown function (DUF4019)
MTQFCRMRAHRVLLAALVALLVTGTAIAQDPRASAAQKAAREFLALTDRDSGPASWAAAGKQFQEAIAVERWTQSLRAVRAPLGALVERTLISTQLTKNFPGAPREGEYVLLVFRSGFEKRAVGEESLTLEREADGVWRVIGYVIR